MNYDIRIDGYGNKYYYVNNILHRENGPAIEHTNGSQSWYVNGKAHREEGPAIECATGDKFWYKNGKLHREDGPAIEYSSGNKRWYLNGVNYKEKAFKEKISSKGKTTNKNKVIKTIGSNRTIYYKLNNKLHREDGPAIEYADGGKEWWINGKLHREDGPAIEDVNGTKLWYKNNKLHREEGPAIEYPSGDKIWCKNGKYHRKDGPAFVYNNGEKKWYLNNVEYTEKVFKEKVNNKSQMISKNKVIKTVKSNGTVTYYLNNKRHREDGPAVEWANGDKEWYKNNKRHREGGPALEFSNGDKYWYKNDKLHREDGPAIEYNSGEKRWYLNDLEYIEGDFNKKMNNNKESASNDKIIETVDSNGTITYEFNGTKQWYRDGKLHREDGPAIEYADGGKAWCKNGEYHREDGPAIESVNGHKAWYLNDKLYSEEEFNEKIKNKQNNSDILKKDNLIINKIIKRSLVQETVNLAQKSVLELLRLLGVKRNSKIFKFFSSDLSNVIVKTALGLFLMYCPLTQELKYQAIADELLIQSGVSSLKEVIKKILTLLTPQAYKFGTLISNLEAASVKRIADRPTSIIDLDEELEEENIFELENVKSV